MLDEMSGIACDNCPRFDSLSDGRTCPDDCSFPYLNTRTYEYISRNPSASANRNRRCHKLHVRIFNIVTGGAEIAVLADRRMRANNYGRHGIAYYVVAQAAKFPHFQVPRCPNVDRGIDRRTTPNLGPK